MSAIAKTVSLCAVFITLVVVMFVFSTLRTPQLSEEELRDKGVFVLPRPRELGPFELQDQDGAAFNVASLQGAWTFMFFGFTHCPDVCPTSMAVLGQVERALINTQAMVSDQPFRGVLVSVDPDRDSLEKIGTYARAFSPRFVGITGNREALVELTQQVNVAFAKVPDGEGAYTIDHTGHIVVINPRGHFHGFVKLPHQEETIRLAYQSLAARF
ncbi:MAG: protein SCO1/2 [Limisphaerales bacterium]|jgi:protein SCO1/2